MLFHNQVKLNVEWNNMVNILIWHVYDPIMIYLLKNEFYISQIWVQ